MTPTLEMLTSAHKESMPWLANSIILLARAGSHAYGTSLPTSDLDFRGVCIAPPEYYLGFVKTFEQAEQREPYDSVIYELRKFMRLAADCNPSIIELLFTDRSDFLHIGAAGEYLLEDRTLFLSQKARYTYTGYAISQLKRIQRHYAWLKNPPKGAPKRADFDLPEHGLISQDQRMAAEAAVDAQVKLWIPDLEPLDPAQRILITDRIQKSMVEMKLASDDDIWVAAARTVGLTDNFIELMVRERRYRAAKNEWSSYLNWKETRNPARAALEEKFGYDTKHGMHLVRLMRMGLEILELGTVYVKRPDAEELLAIRAGAWSYERLLEYASEMEAKIAEAAKVTHLPHSPDRAKLDALCVDITRRSVLV